LIIFVLIDDSGFFLQNKIEAGALHCLQHDETLRPIAGYIQFKPQLNVNNSTALDYMVWLAVHEISHILVINNALYEDYIDPDSLEPIGISNVIGKKIMENGKKMNYIKSPRVLETARKHFNCPDLDGVPLEYNGGVGTAGSHWAKKYMNTDYMIGDSYGENLISDITLALFEDSGWYKVDYKMSNLFLWGKGAGCGFFDTSKKCIQPKNQIFEASDDYRDYLNLRNKKSESKELSGSNTINTNTNSIAKANSNTNSNLASTITNSNEKNSLKVNMYADIFKSKGYTTDFKNEFCTNFNYPICSTSNIFRGICKIRKFNYQLSINERYFKNPKIGGEDSLTDKCPIPIEYKGDQSYYGGSCRVGNNDTLYLPSIEKICPECACFMSNLTDDSKRRVFIQRKNLDMEKKFEKKTEIEIKKVNETLDLSLSTTANTYVSVNEIKNDNKGKNLNSNLNSKTEINNGINSINNNTNKEVKKNMRKEDQKILAPEKEKDNNNNKENSSGKIEGNCVII